MAGRSFTTDSTVSDVEPGVSYRIDLEPKGAARALGPLLVPILRSGLQKDLKRLNALLETT